MTLGAIQADGVTKYPEIAYSHGLRAAPAAPAARSRTGSSVTSPTASTNNSPLPGGGGGGGTGRASGVGGGGGSGSTDSSPTRAGGRASPSIAVGVGRSASSLYSASFEERGLVSANMNALPLDGIVSASNSLDANDSNSLNGNLNEGIDLSNLGGFSASSDGMGDYRDNGYLLDSVYSSEASRPNSARRLEAGSPSLFSETGVAAAYGTDIKTGGGGVSIGAGAGGGGGGVSGPDSLSSNHSLGSQSQPIPKYSKKRVATKKSTNNSSSSAMTSGGSFSSNHPTSGLGEATDEV
jgi:hypothetical protein